MLDSLVASSAARHSALATEEMETPMCL